MKELAVAAVAALACLPVWGQALDEDSIPTRALILSGDKSHPNHRLTIAEMYSRENLAFEDPAAPRFLFLDKKGEVALGIGGYLKAVGEYDFDGAVDNNGFYTNAIPVPFDPAQRNRFGATASNSTIFLKMVTRPTKLGRVIVYIQTAFTGANYGLQLKQAYVSVGHVTLGKARSTFADGPAMAPTVDDEGPSGQVSAKNMLVKYESPSWGGFSFAGSVELPDASYTTGESTRAISQRFPDIPAYLQYGWGGDSHVRLSGILRELSYRDEAAASNHFATGWGVQFSGHITIVPPLELFFNGVYGEGISPYIQDLTGAGLDFTPNPEAPTSIQATPMFGWQAAAQINLIPRRLSISGGYSTVEVRKKNGFYSEQQYREGQYIFGNIFCYVSPRCKIGAEYLYGTREDMDGLKNHANRANLMVQYNF